MASSIQWAAPKAPSFDGNVSENYRRFEEHWRLFEKTELKGKSQEEKCSYFLLCIGDKGREIHKTLTFETPETETNQNQETVWKRTTAELIQGFKQYCNPRRNITYERHKFNTRNQEEGETIDQYVTVLRTLAATCEFQSLEDGLIRDRIVCGIRTQTLKERLLRETDLTLEKAVNICRATEVSREQIKRINDEKSKNIDALRKPRDPAARGPKGDHRQNQKGNGATGTSHERQRDGRRHKQNSKCGNCGKIHQPKSCFAYGKRCNHCKKLGHFAQFCRSKAIQQLNYESDDATTSEHGIDMVKSGESHNDHKTEEYAHITINDKTIMFKLDSGSESNIISLNDFNNAVPKRQRVHKLRRSNAKLTAYGGQNIPVLGKCFLLCKYKDTKQVLEFQVVKQGKSLLGCESCKALNLIEFHNVDQLNEHASPRQDSSDCKIFGLNEKQISQLYSSCFEGLGPISEPYHIKLDETVSPVVHPPRKLPATLRPRVEKKLAEMEKQGVIVKVQEPTKWVNSMVVNEKKSGDLRICIDPRDLNKAIKREHYQLPTQQEIMSRLAGARYFSKLDAKSGFWQIPLDNDSSYLTTFNTPFGRYRFTVVPFGVVFAQEVFHRTLHEHFNDIDGCETDIDDILVWGRTIEEHDKHLEKVLDRAKHINLTLGADKCEFRRQEITYLGERLTPHGLKPDESKIKAINDYERPTSKQDVQRLLGMVNFVAKFAPHLSDETAPLRELTKKGVEFHWLERHEKAFNNIKSLLTHSETLKYYDVNKDITLQVDASQDGLGAALIQEHGPVAYASKALNPTQKNYAQIEKELLAIVFGCKRFHQYVYGKHILIETDHKPLEAIFNKPLSQAPSRLQKMLLQLQEYDITLKYTKGTEMYLADALSRAFPVDIENEQFETDIEEEKSIHLMSTSGYVTDRKLTEIQTEIHNDETMQSLIRQIRCGWPENKHCVPFEIREYYSYRHELTEHNGLVYKAQNILIPPRLRSDTLTKLHRAHQGMEKTKRLARECIFWPGMNSQIENLVPKCPTCLQHRNANCKEPLNSHELPSRPWQRLATDLFEWKGKPHIVIVDYYSRYPEVAELRDTKSRTVINKCKSIFSRHGIPESLVSDNGPQYASREFKQFADEYGFHHTTTSPIYPQSGGMHEKTVQTIKSILEKCLQDDQDPYLALLDYRNTPIDGVSPSEALMGRKLRSSIPTDTKLLEPNRVNHDEFRKKRTEQQQKQKIYYDRTAKPLPPLQKGDSVRVKVKPNSSHWKAAKIITNHNTPRSYVVQTEDGSEYRRNRRHIIKTKEEIHARVPHEPEAQIPVNTGQTQFTPQVQVNNGNQTTASNENLIQPTTRTTRSGRTIKPVYRYGFSN